MRPVDGRLEQLLGPGGAVLTAMLGYGNPAMGRMIGVSMERALGRRLLGERPEFREDEAYKRMRGVVETGTRAHGDDFEGSGIGLAVCRKIVEAHGGAIAAQRAVGGGTIVRFSLPANPARVVVPVP